MRFVSILLTLMLTVGGAVAGESEVITERDRQVGYILEQTEGLRPEILQMALDAYHEAEDDGHVVRPVLTIIDYELPSYEKRLWVINTENTEVLYAEWVSHGMGKPRGSGGDMERALSFSNLEGSRKSSLGVFATAETYYGKHGYSLKLDGLEPGVNDAARDRTIVIHGARYVTSKRAENRNIGRSWGCPAVRPKISKQLIDAIKGGSVVWVHYPDAAWLENSPFLDRYRPEATSGPE